jgi:fructokinase
MVENADVVKFSDDELLWYANETDLTEAINKTYVKGSVMAITQGKYGCLLVLDGKIIPVPTVKQLKPVDTTGAGDAFFGALLAYTDGKKMTKERLIGAFQKANDMGAEATQHHGALGHILK